MVQKAAVQLRQHRWPVSSMTQTFRRPWPVQSTASSTLQPIKCRGPNPRHQSTNEPSRDNMKMNQLSDDRTVTMKKNYGQPTVSIKQRLSGQIHGVYTEQVESCKALYISYSFSGERAAIARVRIPLMPLFCSFLIVIFSIFTRATLARVFAIATCLSVCLSVCASVTRRYCA